jgi:anti-anti-sigma factor
MYEEVRMNLQATAPSTVRPVPKRLTIEIEHNEDECLLRCNGHFRAADDPQYLRDKVDEIETLGCTRLLLDFRDVLSLGSSGLSFLVNLYHTSDGRIVLASTQPRVREVLEITRLSTLIPMTGDIESGLAEFDLADLSREPRLPECPPVNRPNGHSEKGDSQ